MITATELIINKFPNHNWIFVLKNIEEFMIEFAKMHVQEALRLSSAEAEVEHEFSNPYDSNSEYTIVNKESILNAYPLENIK